MRDKLEDAFARLRHAFEADDYTPMEDVIEAVLQRFTGDLHLVSENSRLRTDNERLHRTLAFVIGRDLRAATLFRLDEVGTTKEEDEDENHLPMWGVELRNGRWLDTATMKAGHGTSTQRDKAHRFKTKREAEMEAEEWSFAGAMAKCLDDDDDKGTP